MARARRPVPLAQQLAEADSDAVAALDLFAVAATQLESAADRQAQIAETARAEAEALVQVQHVAESSAANALAKANQIRSTFGV